MNEHFRSGEIRELRRRSIQNEPNETIGEILGLRGCEEPVGSMTLR